MHFVRFCWPLFVAGTFFSSCDRTDSGFHPGTITGSQVFHGEVFRLDSNNISGAELILIEDDNIVLDFGGMVIDARQLHDSPDQFKGIAIHIRNCANIEIRNLSIHGFRIAVLAENVDSLKLINCNFSYNYRPRLYSKWDRESLNDWLYFHDNADWPKYAGAVFLKDCNSPLIKGNTILQGFNGLMLDGCNDGLIYNNNIRFNSGLGIGMYESSRNRIMHNRLDWNVRGYSHGKYDRGQDSAGILLYEQCNDNTIAYNSATHSGDGLFLWAGKHTMDTGEGGCNRNLIYRNDFSHSVANGIEATFSSNFIIANKLNDCRYGIWAGYSHHTVIMDNEIRDCDHGIAIEHGNNNVISTNALVTSPSGIELWERAQQPSGWGYVETRNVASRAYEITGNVFDNIEVAISLMQTDSVYLSDNQFDGVNKQLNNNSVATLPSTPVNQNIYDSLDIPDRLVDGMNTVLEEHLPRGRKYILVNEWGPYNFEYPDIFLRRVDEDNGGPFDHTFALFGPVGNWKLLPGARGIEGFRPKSGAVPATVELKRSADSALLKFELGYLGPDYVDQFGDSISRGGAPNIRYTSFEPMIKWEVDYYNYNDSLPPGNPEQFVSEQQSISHETRDELKLTFWRSPATGVNDDHYLTHATGSGVFEEGKYILTFESDDGAILKMDGRMIYDTWNDPLPDTTVQLDLELYGKHVFEVYHYDLTGLSNIDLSLSPVILPERKMIN